MREPPSFNAHTWVRVIRENSKKSVAWVWKKKSETSRSHAVIQRAYLEWPVFALPRPPSTNHGGEWSESRANPLLSSKTRCERVDTKSSFKSISLEYEGSKGKTWISQWCQADIDKGKKSVLLVPMELKTNFFSHIKLIWGMAWGMAKYKRTRIVQDRLEVILIARNGLSHRWH